jgi:RNA polymerase sigma-70 factor (ECF subfamily)
MNPSTDLEAEAADADLVARALKREDGAFELLIQKYQALVHLVAYRQAGRHEWVDDIAQEAFVKALLNLKTLKEPNHFKAWLMRITANLARDYLRKQRLEKVSLDDTGALAVAEQQAARNPMKKSELKDTSRRVMDHELRGRIVEAIYALPAGYQEAAAMRYLEELPYQEMARRMGIREEALRKRVHRANQMLRGKLKELWPEDDPF